MGNDGVFHMCATVRPGRFWFSGLLLALAGCELPIQQNIEAIFAPQVLQNAFLLPFTFLFRVFGRLLF